MDFKKIEEALDFLHNNKAALAVYDRKLDDIRSYKGQLEYLEYLKGQLEYAQEQLGCVQEQLDCAQEKGEHKKALDIAVQLLDVLDVVTIAKKTGLTIDQVEGLKNRTK